MKKIEEKKIFELVYGENGDWQVVSTEAPDFICYRGGKALLGVEVTELHRDESHATLKKIDGYALHLLNGGNYLHKDDKKRIRLEKARYQSKDGSVVRKLDVIFDEGISYKEAVDYLMETISKKAKKAHIYLKMCQHVDLIINDASGIFSFEDYKIIFYVLSTYIDKQRVFGSLFREIYLVTTKKDKMFVKIPIKINLFAQDAFIFEKLIKEDNPSARQEKNEVFLLLFYCLRESGYGNLEVVSKDGSLGIIVGSHIYAYTRAGKRLSDFSTEASWLERTETIHECLKNIKDEIVKKGQAYFSKRKTISCYLEMYFPCDEKKVNAAI